MNNAVLDAFIRRQFPYFGQTQQRLTIVDENLFEYIRIRLARLLKRKKSTFKIYSNESSKIAQSVFGIRNHITQWPKTTIE